MTTPQLIDAGPPGRSSPISSRQLVAFLAPNIVEAIQSTETRPGPPGYPPCCFSDDSTTTTATALPPLITVARRGESWSPRQAPPRVVWSLVAVLGRRFDQRHHRRSDRIGQVGPCVDDSGELRIVRRRIGGRCCASCCHRCWRVRKCFILEGTRNGCIGF